MRTVLAAFVFLALAGCGGDSGAAPAPRREPDAAELAFFQRQGAGGATLDTITVRVDGTATHAKRYGGAGGRFRELVLRRGELARVRRALARLPRTGSTITRGTPDPGGAQYLLRYRGRTLTGRAGAIAPAARAAVRRLDGYLDGIRVRRVTRETATNSQ